MGVLVTGIRAKPLLVAALVAGLLVVGVGPAPADETGESGKIAYSSDGGSEGQSAVWVADADGGNAVDLTGALGLVAFRPVWSPDGFRIAFSAAGDIWLMDADGVNAVNVTDSHDPDAWYSAWSPDGRKLAYRSASGIWAMDVDGGNAVEITNYAWEGATWSPDGSKIAYEVQSGMSTMDVWTADIDSRVRVNLTRSPGSLDAEPGWSPDGSQIAFASDRTGRSGLWVMDADGGAPFNLAVTGSGPTVQKMYPAWSPDGSRIAFVSDSDLWVIDRDGSDAVNLTNTPGLQERWPSWSSDGSGLVFDSSPGGSDIWVIDVDSGDLTSVTSSPGTAEWVPAWQPVFPPVGLVDENSGMWHLRAWGRAAEFFYGNPADEPFVGDWDCDGVETPGLFRSSDAFVYLRNANTEGVADRRFFFGDPGDVPMAGDFDGDGCDTVSIYRPSQQRIYIMNELGSNEDGLGKAEYSFMFGNAGDKPVVGDWDGDGIDEIGLHRESSGFFYYRDSLTTGVADGEFYFGNAGDRFVAGDWGIVDGVETPALFRPGNNTFYFRHTLSQGIADSRFPWQTDSPQWYPVAGAFDLR